LVDLFPTQPKVDARTRRIEERYETRYRQLADVVQQMGGLVPPPVHLQERVVGAFHPEFISSGETIVRNVRDLLRRKDRDLSSFASILDFGCGCGRVTRTLHYHIGPEQRLFGTDIDPEAIEWCQANYGRVATFDCNPHMPPTRYEDGAFDLVYSGSVFTHLPEDMQWAWLKELHRITRPGAYLALTFHGVHYYGRLEGEMKAELERTGFVYGRWDATPGLPDFYRTAWHSHDYIRNRWSEVFDIVHIEPRGLEGMQDIALCRRR
jgi:SAM-dependent methyltransferase